jgi:hypothetical protein
MLLYATLIEDVERVVALYLQDHDAHRALAVRVHARVWGVSVMDTHLYLPWINRVDR